MGKGCERERSRERRREGMGWEREKRGESGETKSRGGKGYRRMSIKRNQG